MGDLERIPAVFVSVEIVEIGKSFVVTANLDPSGVSSEPSPGQISSA